MDYTLAQVRGYLRATARLEAEDLVRQSMGCRAAQAEERAWAAWVGQLTG